MSKPKDEATLKMVTLEEFIARGGEIKKVDFSNAYNNNYQMGREFKNYRTGMMDRITKNKEAKKKTNRYK